MIVLLLLVIVIVLSYFIAKYIFLLTHTIILNENVKYPLSELDAAFIKKHNTPFDGLKYGVFYTTVPWNTTTNFNYLLYNKKFYIIEPGYYYLLNEKVELFLKNQNVFFMEIPDKKNKSKT